MSKLGKPMDLPTVKNNTRKLRSARVSLSDGSVETYLVPEESLLFAENFFDKPRGLITFFTITKEQVYVNAAQIVRILDVRETEATYEVTED